jgi:RNA ligase
MNKELLTERVSQKLVSVQKHPSADLFIYNYTPKVQYDRLWDEVTLQTRGLILDADMNVVARAFGKFFNLEEHAPENIPIEPFEVFEKLDGSLGILYWLGDMPFIATRGSFVSDQALHATEVLRAKYGHLTELVDRSKTYLFEIIYPENRIVVNYGDVDDIFLLTIIDNQTGAESIEHIGFPVVRRFDGVSDLRQLKAENSGNAEGFVIRFESGFRIKVKFEEYVRLHRILTGISNIAIWEYLSAGQPLDELLEMVPDEFYDWLKLTEQQLRTQFEEICSECHSVFKTFETRKESALYFQQQRYPSILFNMLDGKPFDQNVWKLIRPKYSKAFKKDE